MDWLSKFFIVKSLELIYDGNCVLHWASCGLVIYLSSMVSQELTLEKVTHESLLPFVSISQVSFLI